MPATEKKEEVIKMKR